MQESVVFFFQILKTVILLNQLLYDARLSFEKVKKIDVF